MHPLSPTDFAALIAPMGPFEPCPLLAVAVSGGADSLALALLAAEWARAAGGFAVALTVDHGLRPDAAAEAVQVGEWLRAAGIEHHILRWDGDKPASDIQAAARAARYGLLENWCRERGVDRIEVATQSVNVPARMLYRKCGFQLQRTEFVFHFWSEPFTGVSIEQETA